MKNVKPVVARNAREIAAVLGLTPADGLETEIRSGLSGKIIEVVSKRGLTHDQVARLAHISRTRVTAVLNRNTQDISSGSNAAGVGFSGGQANLQFRTATSSHLLAALDRDSKRL